MQITADDFKKCFPDICRSTECSEKLLSVIKPRNALKDEQLISQGQISDTVYLLWAGKLGLVIDSKDAQINLGECNPGGWVGELGFIEPDAAIANITATEDSLVLPITQQNLETLLEDSPNVAGDLMHAFSLKIVERLRHTRYHILNKISEDEYSLDEKPETPDKTWFTKLAHKIMGYYGEEQ